MLRFVVLGLFTTFVLSLNSLRADDLTPEQAKFFENEVRPLLAENCYGCHSAKEKKSRGGLEVDSLKALLEGGHTGPAIVPGSPEKSLLMTAVEYDDEDYQMPPKGKLKDSEIAVLKKWVQIGAPWPGAQVELRAEAGSTFNDEDRQWWAIQPVKKVPPPANGNGWARSPIDAFIAEKLQTAKLEPAPEADRQVLIRRLTFDLWGLPPTPEQVEQFVNDKSPDAYERLVDRLLSSPRYGERWARHWLDLVRYAESDGYRADDYRPNAWRYRDYVIKAFNDDKPYDRFIHEQIAGDEMFPDNPEALTATGYLRHWIYEYNNRDARGQWEIIVNDITDTTADVFLGLGLQCARCHDHKFDPLLQKDYYRLKAFFSNVLPRDDLVAATAKQQAEYAKKQQAWENKVRELLDEIEEIEAKYRPNTAKRAINKFPEDVQAMIHKPVAERTPYEHQVAELAYRQVTFDYNRMERSFKEGDKERMIELKKKLAEHEKTKPAPLPAVMAATDVGRAASPVKLPKRNEPVEPGFISILHEEPAKIEPPKEIDSTGRRTALAQWLTNPDNPLTARVMANRIWQHHFGVGLAANASDFGRLGEPPTHPELLDWLATQFVEHGWSMKWLHREIVLSATYRQSAYHPNPALGKRVDPENRLLWRSQVRRLDAEQIRDAIFSATGELDLREGGPGTPPSQPRRSIYSKIMRNNRDPLLDVFDAPYWFNSASSRDTTTTPVQSLLLINSGMMLQRAKAFATRLSKEADTDEDRIATAYRLAFSREPNTEEIANALAFLKDQEKRIDAVKSQSAAASLQTGKIPYRDGQAAEFVQGKSQPLFVSADKKMPTGDFSIEAYVVPRTISTGGTVRVISSRLDSNKKLAGWVFGITGKGSRRKPQTVVMQMFGPKRDGKFGEEAIFSDQHVELNKPYYLCAAVKLATPKEKGTVTFYLKDLSNDDEPLLSAAVEHDMVGPFDGNTELVLGGRTGRSDTTFDGLVDDIRYSDVPLPQKNLLYTQEEITKNTVGLWQFESKPSVLADSSPNKRNIRDTGAKQEAKSTAPMAALADLCHALLNSNEFLYVE